MVWGVVRLQEETEKLNAEGEQRNGHEDTAQVVNGPASTVWKW